MRPQIQTVLIPYLCCVPILLSLSDSILAQDPGFTLQNTGHNIWVAIATDTGRAGGNAGFVIGDDSIAVIDTFEHPDAAQALLTEIRKISQLPIRYVVNTHYHLDHVNGNDVFAKEGAFVIAHRNVRAWVRTENLKWWGDAIKPEDRTRVQSLKLPDVIYDDRIDVFLGTRLLEIQFNPGHTGGDSTVSIPDAHLIFCGDLLWKDHIPNLMDASTESWIVTLDKLRSNYDQFAFVPGHGGIATAADVTIFRDYLTLLRTAVRDARTDKNSSDALADAILPNLRQKYGTWGFFDDFAKENVLDTAQELSGSKRIPRGVEAGSAQ